VRAKEIGPELHDIKRGPGNHLEVMDVVNRNNDFGGVTQLKTAE
jgi:hypothetical protein